MISLDNLKTTLNAIKCLLNDYAKKKDVPTKLPNPKRLNFTGAVKRSYDGSKDLTVEIPSRPDWNQNDSTAPSYIKNRPFYTDNREVVKIDYKYLPLLPKPDGESYLTFSSKNSFTLTADYHKKSWDGTLEYFASDETWTVWDGGRWNPLSAAYNGTEYVIYLRGTGNTVITGYSYSSWKLDGSDIACIGNIETLLDYSTVKSGQHPTMDKACYYSMFKGCTSLTQAPELPATTLSTVCYYEMFKGCTSLAHAPALPATTLEISCYASIFEGCASLTHAPALPETTLARNCYAGMFKGCTSLTRAPALPATTLAYSCYEDMFKGCTSLTHIPELPATTLAERCYAGMFYGCTSLIQAPDLPAITLASECYYYMFTGCTNLKLSTTKTEEYTQEYRIPSSGDGAVAEKSLYSMFISTGGTFTGEPKINKTYYLSSNNIIARGSDIANLNGYVQTMIDTAVDIPTTLPNPNAITFTGAFEGSYDGSEPLTVEIPSGGGGGVDMGITGATVGQIAKITAVDASGVPTAWSPVDMPSGGGTDEEYELIFTDTVTEDTAGYSRDTDANGNTFALKKAILIVFTPPYEESDTSYGRGVGFLPTTRWGHDCIGTLRDSIKSSAGGTGQYEVIFAELIMGYQVCTAKFESQNTTNVFSVMQPVTKAGATGLQFVGDATKLMQFSNPTGNMTCVKIVGYADPILAKNTQIKLYGVRA